MSVPVTELGQRLADELWRSGLPRPKALEVGRVFEDLQRDRDDLVGLLRTIGVTPARNNNGDARVVAAPDTAVDEITYTWLGRVLGPSDG